MNLSQVNKKEVIKKYFDTLKYSTNYTNVNSLLFTVSQDSPHNLPFCNDCGYKLYIGKIAKEFRFTNGFCKECGCYIDGEADSYICPNPDAHYNHKKYL